MKLLFYGKIQDGKLELNDKQDFIDTIAKQKDYPQVLVKLEDRKKVRSNDFNSYYFGYVLSEIAKNSGDDDLDDLHGELKKKFLPRQFRKVLGKEVEVERRSRNLPTDEFKEYVDKVKRLGEEMFNIRWFDINEL